MKVAEIKEPCMSCRKATVQRKNRVMYLYCAAFIGNLPWSDPCPGWTDDPKWQQTLAVQAEQYRTRWEMRV